MRRQTARTKLRKGPAGLRFALMIDLFVDHMQAGSHVAGALRETADIIDDPGVLTVGEHGGVRDLNGITVGRWEVTRVED